MPKSHMPPEKCEQLIELVRQHPPLYNSRLAEHRDANLIYNTWSSIAKVIYVPNFGAVECKKKWRNIRDTYVKKRRETRTTKSGQGAEKGKKWKFFHILQFLEPYVEENSTDSNVPEVAEHQSEDDDVGDDNDDEDENDDNGSDDVAGDDKESELRDDDDSTSSVTRASGIGSNAASAKSSKGETPRRSFLTPRSSTPSKKRRQDTSKMEDALTDLIKQTTKSKQEFEKGFREEKTVEDVFFEACAMRMKQLPPTIRSFLQLQITQLFINAENPDLQPLPITPLPTQNFQATTYFPVTHSQPQQNGQSVMYSMGTCDTVKHENDE